jgi:hypothetical protein
MLTQADVEQYLAENSPLPRGAAAVGAPPTIAQLRLVPCEEAEALGNFSLGLPAGILVWYVELHGSFSGEHLSRPPHAKWCGGLYDVALLVLGAETGWPLVKGLRHS